MRTTTAALLLVLAAALTGCTSDAPSAANTIADCTGGLRFQGTVYRGVGYVDAAGERLGTAEVADCDDMGPGAGILRFSADRTVTVWSVGSVDPGRAIAQVTAHGVAVFLADREFEGGRPSRLLAQLDVQP